MIKEWYNLMNLKKKLGDDNFYEIDKYYKKRSRILKLKGIFSKKARQELENLKFQTWLLLNPNYEL